MICHVTDGYLFSPRRRIYEKGSSSGATAPTGSLTGRHRLDLSALDQDLHRFTHRGLAN